MSKITDELKTVYNEHLCVSRKFNRKPFRPRKDFSKFEEDDRFRHYYFLTRWFKKHSHINMTLFFEATLYFNRNQSHIPITEYIKSSAMTNYTQYCKIVDSLSLTNPKSIEFCVESFKFIRSYCKERGIDPKSYLEYREAEEAQPIYLTHVKGHKVCRYALFAFDGYYKKIERVYREPEMWGWYFGNGDLSPFVFLKRYEGCDKFKLLTQKLYRSLTKPVL